MVTLWIITKPLDSDANTYNHLFIVVFFRFVCLEPTTACLNLAILKLDNNAVEKSFLIIKIWWHPKDLHVVVFVSFFIAKPEKVILPLNKHGAKV